MILATAISIGAQLKDGTTTPVCTLIDLWCGIFWTCLHGAACSAISKQSADVLPKLERLNIWRQETLTTVLHQANVEATHCNIPSDVQFLVYTQCHFSLVACTPSQLQGLDSPLHPCCHGCMNSYVTYIAWMLPRSEFKWNEYLNFNVGGNNSCGATTAVSGFSLYRSYSYGRPVNYKRDKKKEKKLQFEVTTQFSW